MTSLEGHKRRIKEHLSEIQDAIDAGISAKPVTIGFHCSSCTMEMLEMYLHKTGRISTGKMVKHEWFKRPLPGQKTKPLIERNLPAAFREKDAVYGLIYDIEENRSMLIYGKSTESQIRAVLDSFLRLKELMTKLFEEAGETIE